MAIHRFDDGGISFDIDDAPEVLGHPIRLVDNLDTLGGFDDNINRLCDGLHKAAGGALTIYLDLPATGGGQ